MIKLKFITIIIDDKVVAIILPTMLNWQNALKGSRIPTDNFIKK